MVEHTQLEVTLVEFVESDSSGYHETEVYLDDKKVGSITGMEYPDRLVWNFFHDRDESFDIYDIPVRDDLIDMVGRTLGAAS